MYRGKNIVITGAANGIGFALSEHFEARGAHVHAVDIDKKRLAEWQSDADSSDQKISTYFGDVTKSTSLKTIAEKIEENHGQISYWFNNAGVAGLGAFDELSEKDFSKVIGINLFGVVNGTRVALNHMSKNGFGTIINIASVAGLLPAPMMSAYNASKHGVVGFTRSISLELKLKKSPVKIVNVCPGFVETALINKGESLGFPEWLSFMLSTPETVVREIDRGLRKGSREIVPTFNGKMMKGFYRVFPNTTSVYSKILFTKNWRDAISNKIDI
jgi:short-subunit dehydrogenase